MKKKILILSLVLAIFIIALSTKVNASGGSAGYYFCVEGKNGESIYAVKKNRDWSEEKNDYEKIYCLTDAKNWTDRNVIYESEDLKEFINAINQYLPEGLTFKINEKNSLDIYMKNLHYDGKIVFENSIDYEYNNLYIDGTNEVASLDIAGDFAGIKNIIGYNNAKLIIDKKDTTVDDDYKYIAGLSISNYFIVNAVDSEYSISDPVRIENVDISIKGHTYGMKMGEGHTTSKVILDNSNLNISEVEYGIYGYIYNINPEVELINNSSVNICSTYCALMCLGLYPGESETIINLSTIYPEYKMRKYEYSFYYSDKELTAENFEESLVKNFTYSTKTKEIQLKEKHNETIIKGENLKIIFDYDASKFKSLTLNDKELTRDIDYTVESGSTIITISKEYTKQLDEGEYNIKAIFEDGKGETSFSIKDEEKLEDSSKTETIKKGEKDKTPNTGYVNSWFDNIFLFILSLFRI